jgi:hypothetical protein
MKNIKELSASRFKGTTVGRAIRFHAGYGEMQKTVSDDIDGEANLWLPEVENFDQAKYYGLRPARQ